MHKFLRKLQPILLATIAVLLLVVGWLIVDDLRARPETTQRETEPMPALADLVPTPPVTPHAAIGGVPEAAQERAIAIDAVMALMPTESASLLETVEPLSAVVTESIPSPSPLPTETAPPLPSDTLEPPPTATSEPLPTETPLSPEPAPAIRVSVNGVPFESIVVLPPTVRQNAQAIFAAGQALGRSRNAYSKVGDSTTEPPHFMARFDTGPYNLGDYAHLQPVINHFLGSHSRDSIAGRIGMHSWTAVDPAWADKTVCLANESPVACEIRIFNPSILLIRLGTNDVGATGLFESSMRQIVETAIAAGVIPVIGTKGDRHEGSNQNNDILRRIAADYNVPLWDYDQIAETLPGRGLDVDGAHMSSFFAHDYRDPTAFQRGHSTHNLTALLVLDALWREIMGGG